MATDERLTNERQLLASVIGWSDVLDEVTPIVCGADFFDDSHRTIWDACCEIHGVGKPLDEKAVIFHLRDHDLLTKCGGAKYLGQVITATHTRAHAVYLAEKVREAAVLDDLQQAANRILEDSQRPDVDADAVLARAERVVLAIQDRLTPRNEILDSRTAIRNALAQIEARTNQDEPAGVPTGFRDLDTILGGLRPGQFIVLAARPSVGKSALALNIADHIGRKREQPVLFCSLEMSAQELSERLLCSVSGVTSHRIRQGTINAKDRGELIQAADLLKDSQLHIDDTASTNVRWIAAKARRLKRKLGLSLIVVDYVQLVEAVDRRMPREQQVASITRALKQLAKELQLPVLGVAQLNRQADGLRPKLSHLRESGAFEQDADVVLFIHREEPTEDEKKEDTVDAEVIVAKQRSGPCGDVKLRWRGRVFRFENGETPARVQEFDDWNNREPEEDRF